MTQGAALFKVDDAELTAPVARAERRLDGLRRPSRSTGTVVPSKSTVWPPLPGVTPPTMLVPESSIRWVCLEPSEPVMPCTMTLLVSFKKIAIGQSFPCSPGLSAASSAARSAAPSIVSTMVTSGMVRLVEDAASLVDVVAVEADDERLVGLVAEQLERVHDAVGDGVAGGDATEDVHEHALDLRVRQDHFEAVRHHGGGGAAADVERKFAGLTPPWASPAYDTTSSVDMTSPAPLPMMPTEPSRLT